MFKFLYFTTVLQKWLSLRTVYHSLIWGAYLGLILAFNSQTENWVQAVGGALIHIAFAAVLVYFNFIYLIPKYLKQKEFASYTTYLLLVTMLITPLELVCLYWNLSGRPAAQFSLVTNQGSHFLMLLLLVSLGTILKIIKEWFVQERVQRSMELKQKELETKTLQSELSFLKSQINPHFLFNSLNSIYALALKKSDLAPNLILQLSEMMRYMLYESNEKTVPLEREIKYVENYLALERSRYGDKAAIDFDYDIDQKNTYQIAPLLFITFLENSFKHGLSHQLTGGYVFVYICVENNQLDLLVENSKTELKDERYFKGGIGLTNVRRRLELLYKNNYHLEIEDLPDAYKVNLRIQF
jgi:two-component system, LytTR family, sensor kinase